MTISPCIFVVVHTSGREFFLTFMENYVEADWPTQSNYSLRLYFTTCGSVSAKVRQCETTERVISIDMLV